MTVERGAPGSCQAEPVPTALPLPSVLAPRTLSMWGSAVATCAGNCARVCLRWGYWIQSVFPSPQRDRGSGTIFPSPVLS